jgi:AcrR family transcriptional regulator
MPKMTKDLRKKPFIKISEKPKYSRKKSSIKGFEKSKPVLRQTRASKKSKPLLRQTRASIRRETILTAALDEFSTRGYEACRLDDVAKRANVAKGTIYLYFDDKENLFQELVRSMLTPVVGSIEAMGAQDVPFSAVADHIIDLFVQEIYRTRRKDVIRLIIAEGRRFPALSEFYYRVVLSRVIAAMRALLTRAAARGEVPAALIDFPQILAAPGLMAIVWSALFERFESLDVRRMMKIHLKLLLSARRGS